MRQILTLFAIIAMCSGCTSHNIESETQIKPPPQDRLVENPVDAIRKVLPDGWSVAKVEKPASPLYRPKGNGIGISLLNKNRTIPNVVYEAAIVIMPSDYKDDILPGTEYFQFVPSEFVAKTSDARIYIWGGESLRDQILAAIIRKDTLTSHLS